MDLSNPAQRRVFFEIHDRLPRQSAGSLRSTTRALDMVSGWLHEDCLIADMACGPGASALLLGILCRHAQIICVDLHQPFLDELAERVEKEGLADRVTALQASMIAPHDELREIDLIWCEGGIYNVGVQTGLEAWRDMLEPNGLVVFNEPIWLVPPDQRDVEVKSFWDGYPDMTDQAGVERAVSKAGYKLIGGFDLPEADWWDEYYTPMEARLELFERKYASDPDAAGPITHTRKEIEIRRKFSASYNYRFFAVQLA